MSSQILNHPILEVKNKLRELEKLTFSKSIFNQHIISRVPMIFTDLAKDWPALNKWDSTYLINQCGESKVYLKNIEKNVKHIFPFKEALSRIINNESIEEPTKIAIQMAQILTGGYFSRSTPCLQSLSNDILIPKEISIKKIVEVNFWAGSNGTITELHYDPTDNLLTVLKGIKYLLIFPPSETKYLYYRSNKVYNKSLTHSPINISDYNETKYSKFRNAKYYQCTLYPGQTLFLPAGFWHIVESAETNFAVNIWWLPTVKEFFKYPSRVFWKNELFSRLIGKGTCVPHTVK